MKHKCARGWRHAVPWIALLAVSPGCGDDPVSVAPTSEGRYVWTARTPGTNNFLFSIAGDGADGFFAVGTMGTAVHYDGAAWNVESVGPGVRLSDVYASDPRCAFAIGSAPDGSGVLYQYDGQSWTFHTDLASRPFALWCDGPDAIFLTGFAGVLEYDGESWRGHDVPRPPCPYPDVTCGYGGGGAIWGAGPADVYVAADYGALAHYDGQSWQIQQTGQLEELADIWGSGPDDIFAVGRKGSVVHFDGTSWSPQPSGVVGYLGFLWGTGPDNVYAAGGGVIIHYDGASWSVLPVEIGAGVRDLGATRSGETWAVGDYGMIKRLNGSAWEIAPKASQEHLSAIWGCAAGDLFAVGGAGTVVRGDGRTWFVSSSGQPATLWDVWGTACDDVFAVGDGGVVVHFGGNGWDLQPTPTVAALNGVWGTASNHVLAVGDGGTILRFDGASWVAEDVDLWADFEDAWGVGPGDVFVVGYGTILHGDGTQWRDITPDDLGGRQLFGVWGTSGTNVYAVGAGTLLHYDGSQWTQPVKPAYGTIYLDVWGSGPGDVFVSGAMQDPLLGYVGVVRHFDGVSWTTETVYGQSPAGIWGDGAGRVFAAAMGGTVFERTWQAATPWAQ